MGAEQSTLSGSDGQPSALVVVGPSGVGKGTLIERLMSSSDSFGFSCSHTTRQPRQQEKDGVHYWFTDKATMQTEIDQDQFLEHAHVHDNIYGTSVRAVRDVAAQGKCCILDIDVQGARQVRQRPDLPAIFVFIAPPSVEELEKRLRGRGTESPEQVQQRILHAKQEIASIDERGLYDHVIYNDDVEAAYEQLVEIAARALQGGTGSAPLDSTPEVVSSPKVSQAKVGPPEVGATTVSSDGVPSDRQAEEEVAAEELLDRKPAASPAAPVLDLPSEHHEVKKQAQEEASLESGGIGTHASDIADNIQGDTLTTARNPEGLARWKGKVALVTGASAGIGWAICTRLAFAGVRVVAVARRRERLEELQHTLLEAGISMADFLPIVCDVSKEAEVVALPRIIVKRWPNAGIDILVNNAGLGRNNSDLWDGSTASWVEMVSTNVLGVCMCTREAIQDMSRRNAYGHVINISSMSGHRVPPGSSFYSATKHALRALTEGLRLEARSREAPLRVTSISPGIVETEFHQTSRFGDKDAADKYYGSMKALQADDIAEAVVWALSAGDHMEVNDILVRPTAQRL